MTKSAIYDFLRSLMLPLRQINRAIPKRGKIIDLGCGEGVIAKYLARTKTRNVIGIDNNNKRLQKSTQKNLKFILADIRNYDTSDAKAIIISDVLHHLNYEDQRKLLNKIARGLKKDGVFLIKEIDAGEFVRSRLSRFWDFVFYPKDKIYYSYAKDLIKKLRSLGFRIESKRASRFFPGSTNLFTCQKN